MIYNFRLPWPPSVNAMYKRTKRGVYLSKAARAFKALAAEMLERDWPQGTPPLTGQLKAIVEAYPPDKRKRDGDNLLKCVYDALQAAGIVSDDTQIIDTRIILRKDKPVEGGAVLVLLGGIENA